MATKEIGFSAGGLKFAQEGKLKTYPAVVIRKSVVFPSEKVPIVIGGKELVETVENAVKGDNKIVLIFKKNGDEIPIGILARIHQSWRLNPFSLGMTLEGLSGVKIKKFFAEKNISKAEVAELISEKIDEAQKMELEALGRSVYDQFKKLLQLEGVVPIMIASELQKEHHSPEKISDIVSYALDFSFEDKLELLEILSVKKRLEMLNSKLVKEFNIVKTEKKIQGEVEKEIGKAQREALLREHLKAIEKELGIVKEQKEYEEIEERIKSAKMSKTVEEKAIKELYRLRRMSPESAEAPYIRTYTELDIDKAKKVLDEDHYGLEKAKERVLEYLAVQKLTKGKGAGGILCFVGPPGTGKTSVGQSIARALGRSFVRISLGGIRDEAEIRGHRRTYVGVFPGRIIQGMKNAKTKNPVFMLDEIDKMGTDFRGDPSAALLEVLDPEQNNSFSDHYLEAPFDLSEVLFITTANILDQIPATLKDRMEVIEFPGYTDDEKLNIAKNFLFERVLSKHGLSESELKVKDSAVEKIISKYTREAGVRNLERKLSEIARKIAKQIAKGGERKKTIIGEPDLLSYLGPEEYEITMREEKDEVGVATGLAWTLSGGEIMLIEASVVPGKGVLTLTGQLGDVMQESAKAALSYIRSRSRELKLDPKPFYKLDIHIHVPSGAIPKDGPSAGIAIATALASVLTNKKVRKEMALTGEVTLSGKVLAIGGVKEKVLAAHRAGVETVVLPKDNEKNIVDIPKEAKEELKFRFVKHMDEVLNVTLMK